LFISPAISALGGQLFGDDGDLISDPILFIIAGGIASFVAPLHWAGKVSGPWRN
jgi:hypothetical protein